MEEEWEVGELEEVPLYRIVRNHKKGPEIEGIYVCDFCFEHTEDQMSLDLVELDLWFIGSDYPVHICKSCLSFLIKKVDESIIERSKNIVL